VYVTIVCLLSDFCCVCHNCVSFVVHSSRAPSKRWQRVWSSWWQIIHPATSLLHRIKDACVSFVFIQGAGGGGGCAAAGGKLYILSHHCCTKSKMPVCLPFVFIQGAGVGGGCAAAGGTYSDLPHYCCIKLKTPLCVQHLN